MSCSVVIPTLGNAQLGNTIKYINSGSVIPDEILICIPACEAHKVDNINDKNVKILKTDFRGQVIQRIHGFKNATCEYVMQLDDDILVDTYCIQYLLESIEILGKNAAVAPALIHYETKKSIYYQPNYNNYIKKIYYWLMNGSEGYQPGKIDKSGSTVGVIPEETEKRLIEVEWLAGGCVLHSRENLVLHNYWELDGKAYYEDAVHSLELKNKNIRMFIDSNAVCSLEPFYSSSYSITDYFKNLLSDYFARKYYMKKYSRLNIRIYFFYIASILSFLSKKSRLIKQ